MTVKIEQNWNTAISRRLTVIQNLPSRILFRFLPSVIMPSCYACEFHQQNTSLTQTQLMPIRCSFYSNLLPICRQTADSLLTGNLVSIDTFLVSIFISRDIIMCKYNIVKQLSLSSRMRQYDTRQLRGMPMGITYRETCTFFLLLYGILWIVDTFYRGQNCLSDIATSVFAK